MCKDTIKTDIKPIKMIKKNKLNFLTYSLFFIATMITVGCANMVAPVGGSKDVTPPQVDSLRSTKFGITKFKAKKMYIKFDEWVQLSEPQKITISPPMKRRPEFSLKGKGIEITLKDTLKENTTYTLDFGNSIRDITENNVKKDLFMVFSTGNKIDSMQTQGSLVNAITKKAEANVSIMLYDETAADSIVTKSLPTYFATTNDEGKFSIKNIKKGKYRIFALKDANNDYKFNQASEEIGFLTKPIDIKDVFGNLELSLFAPEKPYKVISQKAVGFGKLVLAFTRKPNGVKAQWSDTKDAPTLLVEDDSLVVFHTREGKQTLLLTAPNSKQTDTITFTALGKTKETMLKSLKPANANKVRQGGKPTAAFVTDAKADAISTVKITAIQSLTATDSFFVSFGRPLLKLDTTKIIVRDSFNKKVALNASFIASKIGFIGLNTAWKAGVNYSVTLLPAAVEDFSGVKNDTIVYNRVKILTQKEVGTIRVKATELDSTKQYILTVTDAAGAPIRSFIVTNKKAVSEVLANKLPNSYGLLLVTDENRNGVWDTGDYFAHRQPELQQIVAAQVLKANWELELTISPVSNQAKKEEKGKLKF